MAIINNISTEIGDIIRIKTEVPAVGIFALNAFLDSTTNESPQEFFEKYFRYSLDGGITWSDWAELITINISNIEIRRKNLFIVEYRYTRSGVDEITPLAVNSVTILGDSEPLESPIFARQFFFRFFDINDSNVLGWALNVLEKLYKSGILPEYIDRNDSEYNPASSDADFLAYWGTITHFFAIFVYYSRQFEKINTTPQLIYQFLENWGIFLNTNITDTHLLYLMQNYLDEFKKRGTLDIVAVGDESTPMGELLRMITFVAPDEFKLALLEPHATGWCVSKSSPTFNYTRHCLNMIKGYEELPGFSDLINYPTSNQLNISITDNALEITPIQNTIVGLYEEDSSKYIEIDDLVDYEIILTVKQESLTDSCLYFGCLSKTENGTSNTLVSLFDTSNQNNFFEAQRLYISDTVYQIRGIIHRKQFDASGIDVEKFKLDIGFGYHLKFNEGFKTRYILPYFYVNRTSSDTDKVVVLDFKLKPMRFNFSLGKLGIKNIIYMLYRNNSTYTKQQIYSNTATLLLPYNTILIDNEVTTINY